MDISEYKGVLVFAESRGGMVQKIAYELLGSGRLRHYRVSNAIRISEAALAQFINEAKAR